MAVDLTPYVPRLVIDWQRDQPELSWRGLDGTMLSADISGFTKLSERLAGLGKRGAEELTALINQCFDGMIGVAAACGGDVLKFGGDALLLFFQGTGHAERASQAAVRMRATIARPFSSAAAGRVVLRMSQGMHSGLFTFFLVDGGHRELIVTGPPVTMTVDCEAEANAGQVLLSPAAAAAVPVGWLGASAEHGHLLKRRVFDEAIVAEPAAGDAEAVDLSVLVPAAQQALIASGGEGEHRQVTIGFVHFAGIEQALERGEAAAVSGLLQGLADIVEEATATYRTHWLSSDVYHNGGKVILTAGAPESHGDDEERMLRTLRAILDQPTGLTLRAGVNRGHVFAGYLGAERRRTYTVMGDAVNLAARLMQKAQPGQLIASRAVLERCRARHVAVALEPFMVKGKSRPIEAAAVEMIAEDREGTARHSSAFVGRDAELAVLDGVLEEARGGRSHPVEIKAGSGVGKSRLVGEFETRHPELRSLLVSCGQYARDTPYFAVRSMLRGLAGIEMATPPDRAGEELEAWLREVEPAMLPWLPFIAVPFAAEVPSTPETEQVAPAFRRAEMHRSIAALLGRVVPGAGLVHIEDAHWLDDASKSLLVDLARQTRRWVFLATRTSDDVVFPRDLEPTTMELAPLGDDATANLIAALARDYRHLSEHDLALLAERCGGNPLFAIELVGAATSQSTAAGLPDSVEALITTRLDTLPTADRSLLRQAAAIGRRVDLPLLSLVVGEAAVTEESRWRGLPEFVAFTPGTVTFHHAVLREVAYEGLSYRRRRSVHAAIGAILEAGGAEKDDSIELLSLHFHLAEDRPRSWRYSVRAGDAARGKWANIEAAQFYDRALRDAPFVGGLSPQELGGVWEQLGDVSELAGRYDSAMQAYARARRQATLPLDGARLLRKQGVINERRGKYAQALRWYGRALAGLGDAGGADGDAAALSVTLAIDYAGVRFRQGRFHNALEWAMRAAAQAEGQGYRRGLAHAYYLIDLAKTYTGRDEPMYRSERALEVFEELGDPYYQGNVLNNLGLAAYFEGRWNDSADYHRRSRVARERAGDAVGAAASMLNLSEILANQGHLQEAEQLLLRARRTFESAPYPIGAALATRILGQVAEKGGRLQEAQALLEEALDRLEQLKAESFVLEARVHLAECLFQQGRAEAAEEEAGQVLRRLATEKSSPTLEAAIHRLIGLAQLSLGKLEEALGALERSMEAALLSKSTFEEALTCAARAVARESAGDRRAEDDRARARALFEALGVAIPSELERRALAVT